MADSEAGETSMNRQRPVSGTRSRLKGRGSMEINQISVVS